MTLNYFYSKVMEEEHKNKLKLNFQATYLLILTFFIVTNFTHFNT